MLDNPYNKVDWSKSIKIQGGTHNHMYEQWHIDNAYNNGMRHIGAHPHYGKPLYPLSDYGMSVPEDALEFAMAEHYGGTDYSNHLQAIGCTLASDESAPHSGFEGTWKEFFDAVRHNLQYPTGGGVVVNHPGGDDLPLYQPGLQRIREMHDYAPDIFLGVEFRNDSRGKTYTYPPQNNPWMLNYWDALLSEGRRVWGFAGADYEVRRLEPYPNWEGRSVLLVNSKTNEECLKAYRDGRFYVALLDEGFEFIDINSYDNVVNVTLNQKGNLKFVTAKRRIEISSVTSASIAINPDDVYVRIEAIKDNEILFSQPIMVLDKVRKRRLVQNRTILI